MSSPPRLALSAATLALLLASSACRIGPHYRPPDMPVPPSYKEASKDAPTATFWNACCSPIPS